MGPKGAGSGGSGGGGDKQRERRDLCKDQYSALSNRTNQNADKPSDQKSGESSKSKKTAGKKLSADEDEEGNRLSIAEVSEKLNNVYMVDADRGEHNIAIVLGSGGRATFGG